MEPLSLAGRKWSWVGHVALLGILLLGPEIVAQIVSGVSSLVTAPLTGEITMASNGYEIFNTELLLVYLIAVLGLNVLMQTGLISIGHSAFFLVGAFTVAILTANAGWSFWAAVPVAAALCGIVGGALALPALRLGAFTLAMLTIGYAFVARDLAIEWRGFTGGGDGVRGVLMPEPFDTLESYYWLIVMAVAVSYWIVRNLLRSPFGRASRSVEENPVAAQSLGVSVTAAKLRAFAVSAVLAGVSGGLYAPLLGFVAPDSATVDFAILLLLMVLLGGAGTLVGPVIGALLLSRIPLEIERVTDQPGEWSLLVYGIILLISVYLVPRGLMSAWWWIRARARRGRTGRLQLRERADITPMIRPPTVIEGPVLSAERVTKTLGAVRAVADLDLRVEAGSVHALIGPNGAGKTTLLNLLSGYLAPDTGRVTLMGAETAGRKVHQRARCGLARTFQTPFVFEGVSCRDNLMVALDCNRRVSLLSYALRLPTAIREERANYATATQLLGAVGLQERAEHAAGDLPPGERRLLELARVLALEPSVVLMDEPAAGLTGEEITELEEVIRALRIGGISVLLVEHHVDFVMRLADEVTVIDFGEHIAHGPPEAIRRDPAVLAAYLGVPEDDELIADQP